LREVASETSLSVIEPFGNEAASALALTVSEPRRGLAGAALVPALVAASFLVYAEPAAGQAAPPDCPAEANLSTTERCVVQGYFVELSLSPQAVQAPAQVEASLTVTIPVCDSGQPIAAQLPCHAEMNTGAPNIDRFGSRSLNQNTTSGLPISPAATPPGPPLGCVESAPSETCTVDVGADPEPALGWYALNGFVNVFTADPPPAGRTGGQCCGGVWSWLDVVEAPLLISADQSGCGQPISSGAKPSAADALEILRTAIGQSDCGGFDPCICDVNDSGSVTASDALQTLQSAVGLPVVLGCSC
jgi:hypothetical protein